MVRMIGGVVAGIAVALLAVMAIQAVGHQLYPYPADVDLNDPEDIARVFPSIPVTAKLFVVAAWLGGALAGGAAGKRITGRTWAVWVITGLIMVGAVANLFVIPHPVWMQIAAIVAPLVGGIAANHLVRIRPVSASMGPDDA